MNTNSNHATGNPADTTRQVVTPKLAPAIEKLLTHFKDNNNFPVVIDSAKVAGSNKGDSLGTNEVKLLAKKWVGDSLQQMIKYVLRDFYFIDSIKASGTFAKWAQSLDIGMTKLANAYALQKIKLNDSTTVLLWALKTSSYEADPFSDVNTVYVTLLYNGIITETSILGQLSDSGDPPSMASGILKGTLTKEGKISIEESEEVDDIDSAKGEVARTHYDYVITSGKIIFKGLKGIGVTQVIVKNE
jgi:hypothetical protein